MLGSFKKPPEHLEALGQIERWTRERFGLAPGTTVLVSEIACSSPGCPPLETVTAFWTDEVTRHQFKVFKPAEKVVQEDLPFAWLKNALIVHDEVGCDCC